MMAIIDDNKGIVELLLKNRADVNLKGPDGCTALMLAAEAKNLEIVKLLLETPGIEINAQTKDGYTALMLAAAEENNLEIVELLEKHIPVTAPSDATIPSHVELVQQTGIGK